MPDRIELAFKATQALYWSRQAAELQEAADQGHATREAAALHHSHVATMLQALLAQLQTLRDSHKAQA